MLTWSVLTLQKRNNAEITLLVPHIIYLTTTYLWATGVDHTNRGTECKPHQQSFLRVTVNVAVPRHLHIHLSTSSTRCWTRLCTQWTVTVRASYCSLHSTNPSPLTEQSVHFENHLRFLWGPSHRVTGDLSWCLLQFPVNMDNRVSSGSQV